MTTDDDRQDSPRSASDGSYTVMQMFGVELKVRNERLAEVLTMEAAEALSTDVRVLVDPSAVREAREELAEALPDVAVAFANPLEHEASRARAELRSRADAIAQVIGFELGAGGVWVSPTGVSLVTRVVEHAPSFASAVDLASKLSGLLSGEGVTERSALLIVDSQQTADVFKVAIRQRRLYDVMRTISLDNLESIRAMHVEGSIDHMGSLVLLCPLADIDVGEVLSIIRSAHELADLDNHA